MAATACVCSHTDTLPHTCRRALERIRQKSRTLQPVGTGRPQHW